MLILCKRWHRLWLFGKRNFPTKVLLKNRGSYEADQPNKTEHCGLRTSVDRKRHLRSDSAQACPAEFRIRSQQSGRFGFAASELYGSAGRRHRWYDEGVSAIFYQISRKFQKILLSLLGLWCCSASAWSFLWIPNTAGSLYSHREQIYDAIHSL